MTLTDSRHALLALNFLPPELTCFNVPRGSTRSDLMDPATRPNPRSNPPGRKRTKTFTGCWTCRERKVKCDEIRPRCRECHGKGLECEGYDSRLQWLSPDTGPPSTRSSFRSEPTTTNAFSSRREIPPTPIKSALTWGQIDGILKLIDSFEGDATSTHQEDDYLNIKNFGVFRLCREPKSTYQDSLASDGSTQDISLETELLGQTGRSGAGIQVSRHATDSNSLQVLASPSCSEAAAARELCNLHEHQSSDEAVDSHGSSRGASDAETATDRYDSPEVFETSPASPQYIHSAIGDISPGRLPTSVLSTQERFLMHHYVHTVVNIFCVIDNAKSPWKTIHIPRAVQGAGEMSIRGSTSKVRSALRNSLLSISAFFLSNVHASRSHQDEARKWVNEAMSHRYNAIGLLKQAVEDDLYSGGRPKYKEYLATMLSMITINVMSGDTSTCGVHLDGARQLISRNRKSRISGKTKALHRIYFYLRVIYESTQIRNNSDQSISSPAGDAPRQFEVTHEESEVIEATTSAQTSRYETTEMASFECIYGIPRSLLCLLKDTTELINQVDDARQASGSTAIPEVLETQCDTLEKVIFDWSLKEELASCRQTSTRSSFDIICHQTTSFHNALIIYFAQNIRLLGFRYLRQYVEVVLQSIEAIEAIKTENNLLAAPIFWPAFIAATEAFDRHQQDRFRKWYDRVMVYGIKAVRTGTRVVYEAWERGPSLEGRFTSLWRTIVEETGETLMLT